MRGRNIPRADISFDEIVGKQKKREKKAIYLIGIKIFVMIVVLAIVFALVIANKVRGKKNSETMTLETASVQAPPIDVRDVPPYNGKIFCEINNGVPYFDLKRIDVETEFEYYSALDEMGRCGTAFANLCFQMMPTEERGEIGMIKPTGWHTVKYPEVINDLYLYNRCHLIAYALAGENANERNLITGTRFFNTQGMLPFETKVKKSIDDKGNHVLYRVPPMFEGTDLVAQGVLMEALSVEDRGEGLCFNVFIYNIQPGIRINYSDGTSNLE